MQGADSISGLGNLYPICLMAGPKYFLQDGLYFVLFCFVFHLSALLSSVLVFPLRDSPHEKQDGSHQFSYPQTGQASSVWLGSRPIFDSIAEGRD